MFLLESLFDLLLCVGKDMLGTIFLASRSELLLQTTVTEEGSEW